MISQALQRYTAAKSEEARLKAFDQNAWESVIHRLAYVRGHVDDPAIYQNLFQCLDKEGLLAPPSWRLT